MNIINKIKIGDELYCTVLGEVVVEKIVKPDNTFSKHRIYCKSKYIPNSGILVREDCRYCDYGEVIIFPTKENKNWES